MTPEEFVEQVQSTVVEQNMTIYKDVFGKLTSEIASEPLLVRKSAIHN